jgi:8-oxo-dGTP pyrophosphatase MutT (NUDIX family)
MDAHDTQPMRFPTALAPVLRRVARLPGASTLAHAMARNAAGRHYVGAIAVVATAASGSGPPRVLLAKHTFHGDRWGVPGGWVRRREDPAAACVREVREETGLEVRAVDVLGCELHAVGDVPVPYGGLTVAYRCEPFGPADREPRPGSIELAEVQWFQAADAMNRVHGFERAMIIKALRQLGDAAG